MERSDHAIPSADATVAAWLYRPADDGREVPCVVLGHGFSLTRHDGLSTFAEAFAGAGLAALVVDWRFLGDSGGEPRQRVRPAEQRADRAAAVAWARRQDGIDPDRIVLWGYSMSGGHAVQSVVEDGRIAALLMLCPFLDGLARTLATPPRVSARIVPRALMDNLGRPGTVPVTAPVGGFAAMPLAGEYDGFMRTVSAGSPWRNEVTPGLFTTLPAFRPVRLATKVRVPTWAGLCEDDITVSNKAIERFAARAPQATLRRYPGDHFSPFVGAAPSAIAADQVAFLRSVGLARPSGPDGAAG